MPYLDQARNTQKAWKALRDEVLSYDGVPIEEMERVRDLAQRMPALGPYAAGIDGVIRFVHGYAVSADPADREYAASVWRDFRGAILQRVTGVRSAILRATDKIAREVFLRFKAGLGAQAEFLFGGDVPPLVFEGVGLPGDFYIFPPEVRAPFSVIKLPESAGRRVQRWMAIPHEVGHALFVMVKGLKQELERELGAALAGKGLGVAPFRLKLTKAKHGIDYERRYDADALVAAVWSAWADEVQADAVGILACGGAATVEGQQVLGAEADDTWEIDAASGDDGPESHPTGYLRQVFAIAVLETMGGHARLVRELKQRLAAVVPTPTELTFHWYGDHDVVEAYRAPIAPWIASAQEAACFFVDHKLDALGHKSYRDVMTFTAADQRVTDQVAKRLLDGDPEFLDEPGATVLHALAACIFTFEKRRDWNEYVSATLTHHV